MYDIILFQNRNLSKQELILKFFYLIDPNQIVKEFDEHSIPKDNSDLNMIDNFFHTVFEKIYRASSIYDRYLDPAYNAHESFFGEPGCTSRSNVDYGAYTARLEHMRVFLKLSLRNHCITQGFFNSLSEKNSDKYTLLSATYEEFLRSGYFANPTYKKEDYDKVDSDQGIYQKYNAKYKALKKSGEDSFLWRVLADSSLHMNRFMPSKNKPFKFKAPLVYKHWIYCFFMNVEIATLSKHIKNQSKNTYKFYEDIYKYFRLEEKQLKHPLDQFILHTMAEYYLGFSTVSYINRLMGKIRKSSLNEDSFLKRYRGQILESTLNRLSNCPMPYARHLFFAYALEALRYNENVECKFLSHTPDVAMSRSPMNTPFTEEERNALGLRLLPRFFNTLNHITLPVLSSLWSIVLEKLIDNKELLFELYKTYVRSHIALLTADFSTLSFDDMADCCSDKRANIPSNDIHHSFSLNALEEKLNREISSEAPLFTERIFHQKDLSSMICDFLRTSQECSEPPYITKLFQTEQTTTIQASEVDLFRFNRAKNIFDLFSSKW